MVFGWRTGKSLKNDRVRAVFVRFPFVYLKVPGGMCQNRGGVYRFAPGDRGFQKFPKRFFVRNRKSKADGVAQKERSERSIRFLVGEFPIAPQSTGIRSDGNRVLPDLHSPKNDVVRNYGQIVIVMGDVEQKSLRGVREYVEIRLGAENSKIRFHQKKSHQKGNEYGKGSDWDGTETHGLKESVYKGRDDWNDFGNEYENAEEGE